MLRGAPVLDIPHSPWWSALKTKAGQQVRHQRLRQLCPSRLCLGLSLAPLPTAIPARVDMRTAGGGPCGPWEAWPQPAPADMSQHARPLMPITNTSWRRRDWRVVSEVFPVMFIIWKKCQGGREAGLAQHGCCRHLQSDPVGESAPSLSPFLSL